MTGGLMDPSHVMALMRMAGENSGRRALMNAPKQDATSAVR
jgi:hypothetical protein